MDKDAALLAGIITSFAVSEYQSPFLLNTLNTWHGCLRHYLPVLARQVSRISSKN